MVRCPYCGDECPRPVLPECDQHFLLTPSKKGAKHHVMALRRQQQQT